VSPSVTRQEKRHEFTGKAGGAQMNITHSLRRLAPARGRRQLARSKGGNVQASAGFPRDLGADEA
jgi:hypothetical protein